MPTYTTSITFGYKLKPNLYVLSNKIPSVQYNLIKKKYDRNNRLHDHFWF
jgi:hypothetical protein